MRSLIEFCVAFCATATATDCLWPCCWRTNSNSQSSSSSNVAYYHTTIKYDEDCRDKHTTQTPCKTPCPTPTHTCAHSLSISCCCCYVCFFCCCCRQLYAFMTRFLIAGENLDKRRTTAGLAAPWGHYAYFCDFGLFGALHHLGAWRGRRRS